MSTEQTSTSLPTAAPQEPTRSAEPLTAAEILRATPQAIAGASVLARIAGSSMLRGANWLARGTLATMTEVVRELSSGQPVMDVIDHQVETVRWGALQVLGIDSSLAQQHQATSSKDLRARGDLLLRRSAYDSMSATEHPAFSRILDELVPDEARIMRFMATAGPQPAIDVRTRTPFGIGSERVVGGINMIADMAGCTHPERGQEYLGNLHRLGLILFSLEQVDDPRRYSFIEAQPVTAEAISRVKKAHTIYRSITISTFGRQFCDVCFTLDEYDAGGWIHDVR